MHKSHLPYISAGLGLSCLLAAAALLVFMPALSGYFVFVAGCWSTLAWHCHSGTIVTDFETED